MLLINKDHRYVMEKENGYTISNIIVGDDVKIDLDKPLEIEGDILVAGDWSSNVTIIANGTILIYGVVTATEIQGSSVKLLGSSFISGDIVSKTTAIYGLMELSGSMICYGKTLFLRDMNIKGDFAIKGELRAYGDFFVDGKLYVDGILDASSKVRCAEAKINNIECTNYFRYIGTNFKAIMYANSIGIFVDDREWKFFNSVEDMTLKLSGEDTPTTMRNAILEFEKVAEHFSILSQNIITK